MAAMAAAALIVLAVPTGSARAEGVHSYIDTPVPAADIVEDGWSGWLGVFTTGAADPGSSQLAKADISTFTLREIAVAAILIAIAAIGALVGLAFYDSDDSRLRR